MKYFFLFVIVVLFVSFTKAQKSTLDNYFYIKVKIKGEDHKFLFDNGFAGTAIFGNSPIKSKFKEITGKDPFDFEKRISYTKRKVVLDFPDFDIKYKLQLFVFPEAPQVLLEYGIDGVVGWDIISQHDWLLDFNNYSVQIIDSKKDIEWDNAYKFNIFGESHGEDLFNLTVDSGIKELPIQMKLDLGYMGFMNFALDDIPPSKINKNLLKIGESTSVLNTRIDTSYIQELDIILGNFKLKNTPIEYYHINRSSLLGIGFLKMFNKVALLYSEKTILLQAQQQFLYTCPNIGIHKGKVKSIFTKSSELESLEWNIGDSVKQPMDVIVPNAFQWNILFQKIKNN